MKHRYAAILFIFISTFLSLQGEGFVADTLVRTPQSYVPIQNLRVHDEVLARDTYGRLVVEPITHATQHRSKKLIEIQVNGSFIRADHDHAFYAPQTNAWVKAEDVQSEQYLLRDPLQVGLVERVRHLKESVMVYSLSLAKHHTFCISDQHITVHNAAPALMLAATAAKSGGVLTTFLAANPLVAPITIAVGGAALTGYVIWTLIDGLRSNNKESSKKKKGGGGDSGKEPEKPRNDDFYSNMYEVFEKAVVGKILKEISEPTRFNYEGAKIFKVIKDCAELGIKKGDWFYLDKLHGDHIEVFKKCAKVMRTVLNMDGTQNFKKLANAGIRSIKHCLK